MNDDHHFTEVTQQSWFSRLGESIKGILIGIVLIIAMIVLLFWNEGRAVNTAKSLQEGAKVVISISAQQVNSENEGKLVHLTALATTEEVLKDAEFGIAVNAIKLKRHVEIYQWQETKESHTHEKLGGGTETTTTYHYNKVWSANAIDSSTFRKPVEHQNLGYMPYENKVYTANHVAVGEFVLSNGLIQQMNHYESFPINEANFNKENISQDLITTLKIVNNGYYLGHDPATPNIGDLRIHYEIVKPATVSIIAKQNGHYFTPYITKVGGTVEMLSMGSHSAGDLFKQAEAENTMLTWMLRVVGFIFMTIGFSLIFNPLSVLVSVIPLLGSVMRLGTGIIAFVLSITISFIIIAIAWIYYRPLLAIALIIGAVIVLIFTFNAAKKKQATAEN